MITRRQKCSVCDGEGHNARSHKSNKSPSRNNIPSKVTLNIPSRLNGQADSKKLDPNRFNSGSIFKEIAPFLISHSEAADKFALLEEKCFQLEQDLIKAKLDSSSQEFISEISLLKEKLSQSEDRCSQLEQDLTQSESNLRKSKSELDQFVESFRSYPSISILLGENRSVDIFMPENMTLEENENFLQEIRSRIHSSHIKASNGSHGLSPIQEVKFREKLTSQGYITGVRFNNWCDFTVRKNLNGSKEFWIGHGVDRHEAMKHIIDQMYPSDSSKQLLAEALK